MANKYPLTVNTTFNRIEELALGDNLDLSNSGIYANGSVGTAGQTLASNGSSVYWSTPVSVDWSSPGSLGSNTANAATFTTLSTTGSLTSNGSIITNVVTVAASAIDCNTGTYFTKTATGALTWTVTNVPASGAYSFILELTNGGTGTQTWMTGTKWPGGTAPTLVASGVDVLGFITDDGGTTWRGVHIMADSK